MIKPVPGLPVYTAANPPAPAPVLGPGPPAQIGPDDILPLLLQRR